MKYFFGVALAMTTIVLAGIVHANCVHVRSDAVLQISDVNKNALDRMQIDRDQLFLILRHTSEVEADGCWGTVSDNFDGQIMSVGVLQWNYGQDTLQPLFRRFQRQIGGNTALQNFIRENMPLHGEALFSSPCLASSGRNSRGRSVLHPDCASNILRGDGHPLSSVRDEVSTLFGSPLMRQIQLDFFLTEFTSVEQRITDLSASETVSARKMAWAFDMVVQQGSLPSAQNVSRVRDSYSRRTTERKKATLHNILEWYQASCQAIDQDGCWRDYEYNVRRWGELIDNGLSDEQADLLLLTYLRSRAAGGESGRWQALSFQRRATIVFGEGQLRRQIVNLDFDSSL
jgi:hypothetical protein